MPDNGWFTRHQRAWENPAPGFERALRTGYDALRTYGLAHHVRYETHIGEDGVLGAAWAGMARAYLQLLNGESGRFDCGTIDAAVRSLAMGFGVDLERD